jgi:hypothetical protein
MVLMVVIARIGPEHAEREQNEDHPDERMPSQQVQSDEKQN